MNPLRSKATVTGKLNELASDNASASPYQNLLARCARDTASQLPADKRALLCHLEGQSKPELSTLRQFLISEGQLSHQALAALAASIKLRENQLGKGPLFHFGLETRPARYEIVLPLDRAKQILLEQQAQKHEIHVHHETRTLSVSEVTTLLKTKIAELGGTPFGLIMHSLPGQSTSLTFAAPEGNYTSHVTAFIIQKTSRGLDIVCFDSVSQPDFRVFHALQSFANEGTPIRTLMTNAPLQADGYSCHTFSAQVLKDTLSQHSQSQTALLDSLLKFASPMPNILNPIQPGLPELFAITRSPILNKVAQINHAQQSQVQAEEGSDTRYKLPIQTELGKSKPMNHFLLIKGYHNALKVLYALDKKNAPHSEAFSDDKTDVSSITH